jgi:glycosyltransferase involved in cell wall biosynthesis
MRILYFDYNSESLPAMLRSFELTRAAAALGHTVMLCLCHKHVHQSKWFFEMLSSSQTEMYSVSFAMPVSFIQAQAAEPSKFSAGKTILSVIYAFRFIFMELKKVHSFKPQVIIARPDQVFSFVITSLLTRIPLVLSTDGPIEELSAVYNYHAKWPISLDLWRAKRAKAILYINDVCGNLWKSKGIPNGRLFPCPNGVDANVFKPFPLKERQELRGNFGITDDEIVLGFCGNQRFWHGLLNLFKAFEELSSADSHLRLLVIGSLENPRAAGMDKLADSVRTKIIFTGPVPYFHMPRFMDLMDIAVMPYPKFKLFHFSPMKMFESLSMGKIIVASSQGQITKLLQGLPSAFLYDPENEKGLENALISAIAALKQTPSPGEISRAFAKNGHSWQNRGKQVVAACEYAVKIGAPRRRST